MPDLDYQLVDFDNHYYEAEDAFTRHGDESVKQFVHWVAEGKKRRIMFGTQLHTAIPNPTFNPVGKPGAFHIRLKELAQGGERANFGTQSSFGTELEPLPDHYHQRDARLHVMDEQGVERAVFFPTLAVGVDGLNPTHIDMTYKLFHAFNLWLEEDWGFDYKGRIIGAPFIPMIEPARSVAELDAVLDRGARVIVMRPGPAGGRSPADIAWDPFWARINESGVVAAYHAGAAPDPYSRMFTEMWQQHGVGDAAYEQNLMTTIRGNRSMLDTCLALVLGNLFGRFPNVHIASIELGGEWVEYCLHSLDHSGGIVARQIEAFGVTVKELPSEIFKRHIWVSPFPEENVPRLAEAIGADRVLFGSDWPHLEGTPQPADYMQHLDKLDAASVKRIMRDNALSLIPT
ncbi:MAG: amidohydrolase [Acidobacteria bacterium]|nr:amidohydrolase [Acidobacteriota bacterium]